jgi:hypothetical protein
MTDYIDDLRQALREAAAREYPAQNGASLPVPIIRRRRVLPSLGTAALTRRPLALTTGALTLLAAAAVVAVLLVGAGAGTQPAYALARNPDGTVTVTIRDVATAVPALNARFRQMGIDETVIPVKAGCKAWEIFGYSGLSQTETLTFHPGDAHLSPGFTGVLSAEQLPDGRVAPSTGARKRPLPTCVRPIVLKLPPNASSS